MLFRDSTIDYAVLETARGGILREGLAFDACDVGAVLNVTEDHIGLAGINSVEDLADVKSVVTESVKRRGVSVLNADDPLTRGMADQAGGRLCYFSMNGGTRMSDELRAHVNAGGLAVVREDWITEDQIVIHSEGRRIPLLSSREIPATLGGIAGFNIQNALAAAAIAFGLGIDPKIIRAGLAAFSSSFEQNPGRMNFYDGHDFRVILDYAHNPAALTSLGAMVQKLHPEQHRKIAMVSTPGDRRDGDIREMGRIAGENFDFVVFREDPDRRGRAPGEVLRLLSEGARSAGMAEEDIVAVPTEDTAIDICLREAKPGELVLIMPTDVEGAWQRVLGFKSSRRALVGTTAQTGAVAVGLNA
jgi:cyanophycin synthetase